MKERINSPDFPRKIEQNISAATLQKRIYKCPIRIPKDAQSL